MPSDHTKPIVAFFDVDHTILPTSTGIIGARFYRRQGLLSLREMAVVAWFGVLHYWDRVNIVTLMRTGMHPFIGVETDHIARTMREMVVAEVVPLLFTEAVGAIRWHQQQGHTVVLLSASSKFVIEPIAQHLDVDAIATRPTSKHGVLDGGVETPIPYGDGKVFYAKNYCDRIGADLADAFFYSDSHSDLPLLKIVGHPICANPDRNLRKKAVANGWRISDYSAGF